MHFTRIEEIKKNQKKKPKNKQTKNTNPKQNKKPLIIQDKAIWKRSVSDLSLLVQQLILNAPKRWKNTIEKIYNEKQ